MPRNFKLSPKLIIIGVVILAVLLLGGGGLGGLLGGLGGGGGSNVPYGNESIPQTGDYAQGDLGQMFVARRVNNAGCPVEPTTNFNENEPIYAGLTASDVPQGTVVFARLLRDGQPVEDTREIAADRDTTNTCIWFAFQPNAGFEPGNYAVEMYVNGNLVDETEFSVGGGGLFGSRDLRSRDLGEIVTTNRVTEDGCPRGATNRFNSDEPVYLSMDQSYIPAGTEAMARLYYEGQLVEETRPVRSDRDLETCLWFAFEPDSYSGGFEPGRYEAEMYINGDVVETVPFVVE